jgi:hypothetical protein
MISFASVNWLGVVVGMVVSMILGMLWYGPLFGKSWLAMIGKRAEEIESNPMDYLKTALAAFVSMIFLNLAVNAFGAGSLVEGAIQGALVFIGFGATATFVYTTFEGPPQKVWLLYSAYQVLVFIIMGAVFAVWR